jgi:hypothetical protein
MSQSPRRESIADRELEDLLRAYAEARLTPRRAVLARLRTAAVAEVTRQSAATVVPIERARNRDRFWRRVMAAGLAATLTVASAAAVLAAQPGSALYPARIWAEGLTLPAAGDARDAAHQHRLEQRLAEAQAASTHGDANAVAAALAAYRAEVEAALADLGDNPDRLAQLQAELGRHVAALQALAAQAPSQASSGIDNALDASQQAVERLKEKAAQHGGGRPSEQPNRP